MILDFVPYMSNDFEWLDSKLPSVINQVDSDPSTKVVGTWGKHDRSLKSFSAAKRGVYLGLYIGTTPRSTTGGDSKEEYMRLLWMGNGRSFSLERDRAKSAMSWLRESKITGGTVRLTRERTEGEVCVCPSESQEKGRVSWPRGRSADLGGERGWERMSCFGNQRWAEGTEMRRQNADTHGQSGDIAVFELVKWARRRALAINMGPTQQESQRYKMFYLLIVT